MERLYGISAKVVAEFRQYQLANHRKIMDVVVPFFANCELSVNGAAFGFVQICVEHNKITCTQGEDVHTYMISPQNSEKTEGPRTVRFARNGFSVNQLHFVFRDEKDKAGVLGALAWNLEVVSSSEESSNDSGRGVTEEQNALVLG